MWFSFVCLCGKSCTFNGRGTCIGVEGGGRCGRHMVIGWKGTLAIAPGDRAFQFVPHPEGRYFVTLLHTDEKVAGAWFPMAAGVHKKPDRRRRVSDPVRDNGPVIRRKVAVG